MDNTKKFIDELIDKIENLDEKQLCEKMVNKEDDVNKYLSANLTTLIKKYNGDKKEGLFGHASKKGIEPDFFSATNSIDAVIEVKLIKKGNECDIKNGLAQVIEQALCYNKKVAVLLVFDCGNAKDRDWNENECKYIRSICGIDLDGIKIAIIKIRLINGEIKASTYSSS